MDYKLKLKHFNDTEKYHTELDFLLSLLHPHKSDRLLDYGCGTGHAMRYIRNETNCDVYGYDVTDSLYEGDPFYFRKELFFKVDHIYFMHSFSHLPNPQEVLEKCKGYFLTEKGTITIISPNPEWLQLQSNATYTPDPTVKQHHSQTQLAELLTQAGFSIELQGQFGAVAGTVNERLFVRGRS